MLFQYQATTKDGLAQKGSIDAPTADIAIESLQKRGLIILKIKEASVRPWWQTNLPMFSGVKNRDIVILSRQIATLFEAKVSVLQTFRLLASEASSPLLRDKLTEITDDIKGGQPISDSLAKHPKIFSDFYVNMVRSGEESGKLSETFTFLADYLDRTYALMSKAKNALIYPAFVILTFIVVMVLMLTYVIPRLSEILEETGQELPIYTKIVIGMSDLLVNYGFIILILLIIAAVVMLRYLPTAAGKMSLSRFKLGIPYIGNLYRKLYLARVADNMNTLITSGVSMVRSMEITADVVGNEIYRQIFLEAAEAVKSGNAVSDILAQNKEIPGIMVQMIRVGEESGKLGFVLDTMAKFYRREVDNEVDTLVGLIEPAMIVLLGLGVGVLLTSVLVPIYNVANSF
ncbi:MAG: type II secretion system F family protein [Candidatus Paceibacterota bacterium]